MAESIYNSAAFARIRSAHAAGLPVEIQVDGTLIVYEPDLPASGMTLFGEDGFVIGPEAFSSEPELARTVLHESYRLRTSEAAGGVFGELAAAETDAAASFAA